MANSTPRKSISLKYSQLYKNITWISRRVLIRGSKLDSFLTVPSAFQNIYIYSRRWKVNRAGRNVGKFYFENESRARISVLLFFLNIQKDGYYRVFKNLVIHELEYSRNFFDRFGMDFWVIIESRVNLKKNSNRWKLRCKLQESARISRHRRYFLTKTVESSNVRTNFLKELIEKQPL